MSSSSSPRRVVTTSKGVAASPADIPAFSQPQKKPGDSDRSVFAAPRSVSELLYSAPRWPEVLGPPRKPATPGRPGVLGGKGVDWAPRPAPTERELRLQLTQMSKGGAGGAGGSPGGDSPTSPQKKSGAPKRDTLEGAVAKAAKAAAASVNTSREIFPEWLRARPDFAAIVAFSEGLQASGTPSEEASMKAELDMITACAKPKGTRTPGDLLAITRQLRSLACCSSFDPMTLEAVSSRVTFQAYGAGEVICMQGEPGEHFFMVMSGQLAVEVRGLGEVALLKEGNSFGELALTSAESRQATVRTLTDDVKLLVLDRGDYSETLAASQNRWISATVDFLAGISLFSKWSRNRLTRLAIVLSVEYAHQGQEVVAQGTEANKLYLVRKGELQMVHYSEVYGENRWPASKNETATGAVSSSLSSSSAAAAHGGTSPGRGGFGGEGEGNLIGSSVSFAASPSSSSSPTRSARFRDSSGSGGGHAAVAAGTSLSVFTSGFEPSSSSSTTRPVSPRDRRVARSISPDGRALTSFNAGPTHVLANGRRIPSPPRPRAGWGSASGGTLAYSPRAPPTPRATLRPGETIVLDTSGHFPMSLRRTKNIVCEPIGEVRMGACYGLSLIATTSAHPFSLIAKTPCILLYLDARYLRPNALAGYDVVNPGLQSSPRDGGGDGEEDEGEREGSRSNGGGNGGSAAAGRGTTGSRLSSRALSRNRYGGDTGGNGSSPQDPSVPLPDSRYTQVISRAASSPAVAHLTLAPPTVAPAKGSKTGHGQDELGIAFPTCKSPTRGAVGLTAAEVGGVLEHVVNTQDVATTDANEERSVSALLASIAGTGVTVYATAAQHLRSISMATKHSELSKRLRSLRRNSMSSHSNSAPLVLDIQDCEKILRRMLTRLDDDNRSLQLQMRAAERETRFMDDMEYHGGGAAGHGHGHGDGFGHGSLRPYLQEEEVGAYEQEQGEEEDGEERKEGSYGDYEGLEDH